MTVQQLMDELSKIPSEERNIPVFFRVGSPGRMANIIEVEEANKETYGFFGKELPCVILDK